MKFIGKFVTAKLKGKDDCRQGAVISEAPLIIQGVSGTRYECEGQPTVVSNPPDDCLGCDLPLSNEGKLCGKCEESLKSLANAGLLDDLVIVKINKPLAED